MGGPSGRFFEDFRLGEVIRHATPRTLGAGERAAYIALYPDRFALASSDAFARACGLPGSPMQDLIVFHTVFGRSVADISRNALANLGYAEGRFLAPVWPGDTLTATSQVIGLRQASNGRAGIVWVRTAGYNQHGETVLSYVRWVLVRKRDEAAKPPEERVPDLAAAVAPGDLVLPPGLDPSGWDFALSGDSRRLADYAPGEVIAHPDAVTIDEAGHMMAARLWQNTARVHFDARLRPDGRRLVYGGHVLSLARALSFDGLANVQPMLAINGGTHANPCFAGDTVTAWSQVLDTASLGGGWGALRLRLVAARGDSEPGAEPGAGPGRLRDAEGRYLPGILLDFDYWALVPA
jgi:2-methylfumaryl-CoA hydratase